MAQEVNNQESASLLNRIVCSDNAFMRGIKRIGGRMLQAIQAAGDRRKYGKEVDFSSWMSQEDAGFDKSKGNEYQPSYIPSLKKALALYDITAEDALIDIGSGKGKILAVCAMYPFHKLCGLELSAPLAEIGRKNMTVLGLGGVNVKRWWRMPLNSRIMMSTHLFTCSTRCRRMCCVSR